MFQILKFHNLLRFNQWPQCAIIKYASSKPKVHQKRRILLQDSDQLPLHTYKISEPTNRRLYVWGLAETGALGLSKSLKRHGERQTAFVQHPTRHSFGEKFEIVSASCGYGFSLFAVKTNEGQSLFGTGINTDSQLGSQQHRGALNKPIELLINPAPIEIGHDIQVVKCAAGRAHSLVLTEAGDLFSFGNNAYGQCGRSIITDEEYLGSSVIHQIKEIAEGIESIECGQDHSMFVTASGKVYSCGWGSDGQTGLGHYKTIDTPSLIRGDIENEKIVKLSCAADCVLALNDKGQVFGWGNSEYGQLKCEDDNQQINTPQFVESTKGLGKIVDIASGGSFCLILNDQGDVFVWGYGTLGIGPNIDLLEQPTKMPATLFGRNDFNPMSRVTSITCGINHMGAINTEGDLFMWGKNKYGCLGLGQTNDQYFPFKTAVGAKVERISCGVDHTLAICKAFV